MTAPVFDLADVMPWASRPAPAAPATFDLGELVAQPGFRPSQWQAPAPDSSYAGSLAVPMSDDLRRVLALPRRPVIEDGSPEAAEMIAYVTAKYSRGPRACRCKQILSGAHDGPTSLRQRLPDRKCFTELRLVQAWALFEIGTVGGLLGPIGVGHGKTALDLLAPLAFRDCKKAVLLMPSKRVGQLIVDYLLIAEHFRVPQLIAHTYDWVNHVPGMPELHVYPYSKLSREESSIFLEDMLQPDAVIADEAHRLRHVDTATTSRVMRLFVKRPYTRFAGWTGSITDDTIENYAHLSALALRLRSPVPVKRVNVEDWSKALHFDPDKRGPPGALLELVEPGQSLYEAFSLRLVETEGVVSTTESAIDADLEIYERRPPEIPNDPVQDKRSKGVDIEDDDGKVVFKIPEGWWPGVADCMRLVEEFEQRPDGEWLTDPLMISRTLRELACGFFYRWIYPHNVFPRDQQLVDEWFLKRQRWNKELRKKLKRRAPRLDSEKLCTDAAKRFHGDLPRGHAADGTPLPEWDSEHWPAWRDIMNRVKPETEAVRLSDFLARDAAAWALSHRGPVWYESSEFGLMIAELSGLPMFGGGPEAERKIMEERGDRSIIASISSHGEGLNVLQFIFHEQLVAQPPSSSQRWEQVLGRLHRIGQEAPVVTCEVYRHTPQLARYVDQALMKASYVQGTTRGAQKLVRGWRE